MAATGTYAVYAATAPNGPHGGSVMGLIYGIIGTAFMVFAGLLAARKRVPHWRLGSAQFWLRGHLWLGTLSMPLILYHAGFGWGGLLENVLWVLFGLVFVSGLFGLAVQQILPRIITTRVPLETFPAQIPYQCQRMQFLADRLVSESCGKLDIHDEPIYATFKKLAEFGAAAKKDELPNWPDRSRKNCGACFWISPPTASSRGGSTKWITFRSFFPRFTRISNRKRLPNNRRPRAEAGEKKPSPLEQMKAKKKAAPAEGAEKKPSPLEQMKAKAAAKKKAPAEAGGEEKKLSPIEQMRAKAAAKKKAPPKAAGKKRNSRPSSKCGPKPPPRRKHLPKRRRKETLAHRANAGQSRRQEESLPKPAGEKQRSRRPWNKARAQAAAKQGGNGAKPSPLELAREQAAGRRAWRAWFPKIPGRRSTSRPNKPPFSPPRPTQSEANRNGEEASQEGPIIVPCPECGHELKLPDRSLLGRKARCPLCSFKFVLELPEEAEPVAVGAAAEAGRLP